MNGLPPAQELAGDGSARSGGLLKITDEGVFERGGAAGLDELRRRTCRQHAARIHQRYPITTFGLVHEVGRNEDRHTLVARKIDQRFPETVPRQRIDARGRLVKDKDLGLMDDSDRQREPLTDTQRQIERALIEIILKAEMSDEFGNARRGFLRRQMERCAHEDRGSAGP